MDSPIVFVVDDDVRMRRALCRVLVAQGYRVEAYPSSRQFLAEYDERAAGCLVLDFQPQGLDGLATQAELSRRGALIPIVMMGGFSEVAAVVRAMKAGVVDILIKPFAASELVESVRRAIGRDARARRAAARLGRLQALFGRLSEPEWRVLAGVIAGKTNKRIARDLGKSPKTIEYHRATLMDKLEVASIAHLVRLYLAAFPEEFESDGPASSAVAREPPTAARCVPRPNTRRSPTRATPY